MGPSLEGWHPGLFSFEDLGQLAAAFDPELGVRTREVTLDGLERHIQLVGDLAVRVALGRQPYDAQLAGSERFHTDAPLASRAGAGGLELLARAGGQRPGAAAGGEVERLGERLARGSALASPTQRRPELGQRVGALEHCRRIA